MKVKQTWRNSEHFFMFAKDGELTQVEHVGVKRFHAPVLCSTGTYHRADGPSMS